MSIKLKPPPIVRQQGLTCWAAALSSWTSAVHMKTIPPVEIVKVFQKLGFAERNGLLKVSGILRVADVFALQASPALRTRNLHINTPLADSILEPLLRESHVLVTYTFGGGISHWIVVYGIDPNNIYFMDPLKNALQSVPIGGFLINRWIAFWSKHGPRRIVWPPGP